MGAAISKNNKDHVNNNWDKLKCTPIGPVLQSLGIAPGNPSDTSATCKSSEFSSQFNSSMSEHVNNTNKLSQSMGGLNSEIASIRKVFANIQQQSLNDLSAVANQIFAIYVKIGGLFMIILKQFTNILKIFKQVVNVGSNSVKLVISLIDLIRIPINGIDSLFKKTKVK